MEFLFICLGPAAFTVTTEISRPWVWYLVRIDSATRKKSWYNLYHILLPFPRAQVRSRLYRDYQLALEGSLPAEEGSIQGTGVDYFREWGDEVVSGGVFEGIVIEGVISNVSFLCAAEEEKVPDMIGLALSLTVS